MNRLVLILPLLLLLSLQLKATVTLEGRLRDRTDGDAVAGALLSIDVLARLTSPILYWHTWAMTGLLAALLVFTYWLLTVLARSGSSAQGDGAR